MPMVKKLYKFRWFLMKSTWTWTNDLPYYHRKEMAEKKPRRSRFFIKKHLKSYFITDKKNPCADNHKD